MRRAARPATAFVIGTTEIFDICIAGVHMIVKVLTAASADNQSRKHIDFSAVSLFLPGLASLFLYCLPHRTLYNRLMNVLENSDVFRGVFYSLLELVRFGIGFEVNDISAVFLQGEHLTNR